MGRRGVATAAAGDGARAVLPGGGAPIAAATIAAVALTGPATIAAGIFVRFGGSTRILLSRQPHGIGLDPEHVLSHGRDEGERAERDDGATLAGLRDRRFVCGRD